MDLVASYDSDVEESCDNKEVKDSSGSSKVTKEVDIIDLDSDTDNESESVAENSGTNTASSHLKNASLASKQIDCIDLENNGFDADTSSASSKQNDQSKLFSDSSAKKVDYLNLDESESEEESENPDKNMKSLMETAATLSSVPCGPKKPIEVSNIARPVLESSLFEKSLDSVPMLHAADSTGTARNTPDFTQSSLSRDSFESPGSKRFKGDASIVTNFQTEFDDSGIEKDTSCLFREDERIIEATQKDVVCRIPRQVVQTHEAHSSIVTALNWCIPKYSYLYLSAAMDGYIKVWDLFKRNAVQTIKANTGFNAAKWSLDGGQIIAGGHGEKAFVLDVQTGKKVVAYDIYNIVTSLEIHPYMEDVFLCGTRNAILGFDIRVNTTFPIRSFFSKCEEVLDMAFLDENEFICSTNVVGHDSADRTIMAWDFSSGAILSNQIFLERYTCVSLKVHPTDSSFVAQTNGNYIASFSTTRPYEIRNKRYMGHKVAGYGIECDISPDGKYLASGDAEGNVFFYNYANTSRVFYLSSGKEIPVNRVKWHPAFASTAITATYDGHIQIWR